MPLQILGNNPINVGDGWVPYNPVQVESGRTYLLEFQTVSANPDFIYSRFEVRYLYPTQESPISASIEHVSFYHEPIRQNSEIEISSLLAPTGNLTFFVRRFPFFSQPSNLASCNVLLALDPSIFK